MKEVDDNNLINQGAVEDINTNSTADNKEKASGKDKKAEEEELFKRFLQNKRDVIVDYEDYEEYETLDEMRNAYESQPTIEDKFYYYITLNTRSAILLSSPKHLTEKERVALGMYPRIFETSVQADHLAAPVSFDQDNREYEMTMDFLEDLRLEFFAKNNKKHMTIEGCRGFMEMMGKVSVKPYVNFGLHYDEIKNSLPKEGNTEKDLEYKTNYIMMKGLGQDQVFANQTSFQIADLELKFTHPSIGRKGDGQFHSNVNIPKFIKKEMTKLENETVESFLEHMQVTDPEEIDRIKAKLKINNNNTQGIAEADNSINSITRMSDVINSDKLTEDLADAIVSAWRSQGIKKALGTLSDKEIVAWKRGTNAVEQRGDYKYKKWMQDYGDPICEKMYRKGIKDALKSCNKKLVSTKPVGYKLSDKSRLITFNSVDKMVSDANKNFRIVTVDAEREAAMVKYDAYISSHTGDRIITDSNDKNIVILSKAMAASMLKNSPNTRSYSVKMIHSLAEKLKVSLKLGELEPDRVRNILSGSENIETAINERSKSLYLPPTEDRHREDYVDELNLLSKVMMRSYDRSKEYKEMVKYVNNIGSLESYYQKTPEGMAEMIENGVNLLQATEAYMKGKKSVRYTDDGKKRFDNAIDVLAIIHKHIPEMRGRVEEVVAKINKVRGAENKNHKDHVDITKYGAKRAEREALEQLKKDSGAKEKDLKNIRPGKLS